jgi:hypothetical protein
LAGYRLAQLWLEYNTGAPTRAWCIQRFAEQDAEILASMKPARFWRWFDNGWDAGVGLRGAW